MAASATTVVSVLNLAAGEGEASRLPGALTLSQTAESERLSDGA